MEAMHANATRTKATDILRNEHEIILDVLNILESISRRATSGGGLDLRPAQELLEFLKGFCDRCHHGKEEQCFFASLETRGLPREVGPIAVMMSDHEQGRALLASMGEGLEAAKQSKPEGPALFAAAGQSYVDLMRDHIDKENNVLFPMGDEMLTEADQASLLDRFEHFEHADMGEGAHERFLEIARDLAKRFGLERLSRKVSSGHGCCGHGTPCS